MPTHGSSVAADLRALITDRRISVAALHLSTTIDQDRIAAFAESGDASTSLGLTQGDQPLTRGETTVVSVFASRLTYGFDIGDDERLHAIFESLTVECGFTVENLANLMNLPSDDIEMALADTATLPAEAKYALAIRGSYLINAVTQTRMRGTE